MEAAVPVFSAASMYAVDSERVSVIETTLAIRPGMFLGVRSSVAPLPPERVYSAERVGRTVGSGS